MSTDPTEIKRLLELSSLTPQIVQIAKLHELDYCEKREFPLQQMDSYNRGYSKKEGDIYLFNSVTTVFQQLFLLYLYKKIDSYLQ